jgi:parallel beta-helix repeat protein
VSGNTVRGSWENGIFATGSSNVTIRNNTVISPNRGGVDRWNAGSGSGIEATKTTSFVSILDNWVDGADARAQHVAFTGISLLGNDSVAAGNVVMNAKRSGIAVDQGADRRRVENNTIAAVGSLPPLAPDRQDAGIRVGVYAGSDPAVGLVIRNNTVRDAATGIALNVFQHPGPVPLVEALTVEGNDWGSLGTRIPPGVTAAAALPTLLAAPSAPKLS